MKTKYDELLIQGLTKLIDLEFYNISDSKDINYKFSDNYVQSKEKLIKKLGTSYWRFINTVAKKVAIIIVTLIIAFSSLMTVDAFREKVVDFVYKIYDIFTEIKYDQINTKTYIDTNYTTANIPNSYSNKSTNFNKSSNAFLWMNQRNELITLIQSPSKNSQQFNTEHGILKEVIINDTPCLTCKTTTDYFCYWEYDGYRFELIYPTDLGEEFMSEVVGNLVKIDPAELEN